MNDVQNNSLPFLTREMLDFGKEAKFELEVTTNSSLIDKPITLVGLTRSGLIKFDVSPVVINEPQTTTFKIQDVPISLTVFTTSDDFAMGDFFIIVYLKINGEKIHKLLSGYVSRQTGISFPQTHSESEMLNHGTLGHITTNNPSAGSDWNQIVTSQNRFVIKGIVATLVTDANAAVRHVGLQMHSSNNDPTRAIRALAADTQIENLTRIYSFAPWPSAPKTTRGTDIQVVIPHDFPLSNAGKIFADTLNIQAGDQWSAINIQFEQFFSL